MVNTRLVWFLEKGSHPSPELCGFRRSHSTLDALLRLEATVCHAYAQRQHVISVSFDLEKVYDTTWRYGILKALHSARLRGKLPLFLKLFLRHRSFKVRMDTTLSHSLSQEESVPQGSVLSITLFNITINRIVEIIPEHLRCTLYANDLSITYASTSLDVDTQPHIPMGRLQWILFLILEDEGHAFLTSSRCSP